MHMRKVCQFAHAHNNAELTELHPLLEEAWMLLHVHFSDNLQFTFDIET